MVDMKICHVKTLNYGKWLCDEPVNFYMEMLNDRERMLCMKDPNRPKCRFFNTFFLYKLRETRGGTTGPTYDYSQVRSWTVAKSDSYGPIWNMDRVFFPVHVNNNHWALVVVNITEKKLCWYDSNGSKRTDFMTDLRSWLWDESVDKNAPVDKDLRYWARIAKKEEAARIEAFVAAKEGKTVKKGEVKAPPASAAMRAWPLTFPSSPQQTNGYDCGVFAIMNADYLSDKLVPDYSQSNINMFRVMIAHFIRTGAIPY